MKNHHKFLHRILKKLPQDYDPWGGNKRWADGSKPYPDCSAGCKYYYTLEEKDGQPIQYDWGVCANPKSHRCGLLTFEHQGCQEFKFR